MNVFDQLKAQMRGTPAEPLPADALIIDVRSPAEFAMGRVQDAINLPLDAISATNTKGFTDKEQTIVVYCASGMRSGAARGMLMQLGFNNVINGGNAYETAELTGKKIV